MLRRNLKYCKIQDSSYLSWLDASLHVEDKINKIEQSAINGNRIFCRLMYNPFTLPLPAHTIVRVGIFFKVPGTWPSLCSKCSFLQISLFCAIKKESNPEFYYLRRREGEGGNVKKRDYSREGKGVAKLSVSTIQ